MLIGPVCAMVDPPFDYTVRSPHFLSSSPFVLSTRLPPSAFYENLIKAAISIRQMRISWTLIGCFPSSPRHSGGAGPFTIEVYLIRGLVTFELDD